MACPQCGGTLLTYSLGGREASVCEDCGYVGIAADHEGDPVEVESWDDALRRFYAQQGADADPRIEVARDDVAEERREGESWDDALRRFYAEREAAAEADADGTTAAETESASDDEEPDDDESTADGDRDDDESTADGDRDDDADEKRAGATDDGADGASAGESGTAQSSADGS